MKLISCEVTNFASYEHLAITFQDKGLTLIHGPTGAGKSTICDAVSWTLYGITAKHGSVDDVLPWGNGKKVTTGNITIQVGEQTVKVVRARQKNRYSMFKFFVDGEEKMGKEVADTQLLLDQAIGVNYEGFSLGSYMHEFSKLSNFFSATAKQRRQISDELIDLSLPVRLRDLVFHKTSEMEKARSLSRYRIETISSEIAGTQTYKSRLDEEKARWENNHQQYLKRLEELANDLDVELARIRKEAEVWESEKAKQIEDTTRLLSKGTDQHVCTNCGGTTSCEHSNLKEVLTNKLNSLKWSRCPFPLSSLNHHRQTLAYERAQSNPHNEGARQLDNRISALEKELRLALDESSLYEAGLLDLSDLSKHVTTLRAHMIESTVHSLEAGTNSLLERHFEGELQVKFTPEDYDKLQIDITKNGYACSFEQLSKGQRQILKFCFNRAVAQAQADNKGIQFKNLFLDEILDGLDDSFKRKVLTALTEMSSDYDSILVVEHSSALKTLFPNAIEVTMVGTTSRML